MVSVMKELRFDSAAYLQQFQPEHCFICFFKDDPNLCDKFRF